jgi:hypothetical protein
VPAGTWHLVGDGIITQAVDVEFDILWRRIGRGDVTVATWNHHFEPKPRHPDGTGDFTATAYEEDATGTAIDFADGDVLVFKYIGTNSTLANAYSPDGDGSSKAGRNPYIDLP